MSIKGRNIGRTRVSNAVIINYDGSSKGRVRVQMSRCLGPISLLIGLPFPSPFSSSLAIDEGIQTGLQTGPLEERYQCSLMRCRNEPGEPSVNFGQLRSGFGD